MLLSEVSTPCPAAGRPGAGWMEEGRDGLILASVQGAFAVGWGGQRRSWGTPRPFTLPPSSPSPTVSQGRAACGDVVQAGAGAMPWGGRQPCRWQGRVCQVGSAGVWHGNDGASASLSIAAAPNLCPSLGSFACRVVLLPSRGARGGESLPPTSGLLAAAVLAARRGCLPPAELEQS